MKDLQIEKLIDKLIYEIEHKITEENFIENIKYTMIRCLEETDKKLSEYSEN